MMRSRQQSHRNEAEARGASDVDVTMTGKRGDGEEEDGEAFDQDTLDALKPISNSQASSLNSAPVHLNEQALENAKHRAAEHAAAAKKQAEEEATAAKANSADNSSEIGPRSSTTSTNNERAQQNLLQATPRAASQATQVRDAESPSPHSLARAVATTGA
jgi:hypothetical protein